MWTRALEKRNREYPVHHLTHHYYADEMTPHIIRRERGDVARLVMDVQDQIYTVRSFFKDGFLMGPFTDEEIRETQRDLWRELTTLKTLMQRFRQATFNDPGEFAEFVEWAEEKYLESVEEANSIWYRDDDDGVPCRYHFEA